MIISILLCLGLKKNIEHPEETTKVVRIFQLRSVSL